MRRWGRAKSVRPPENATISPSSTKSAHDWAASASTISGQVSFSRRPDRDSSVTRSPSGTAGTRMPSSFICAL